MKVSPYQIAAFTHAARERSFTRAAATLGVTQSSVTQHVARLEQAMGTKLFVRRRGGLELTSAARELFALSDRIRILEQLVSEKIGAYGELSAGHLSIIANAPRPAMPLIAGFSRLYPKIEITFSLFSWTVAMEFLQSREVDIAIIADPPVSEDLFALELVSTRLVAIGRADTTVMRKPRLRLADLVDEPLILPEDGSLTQRVVLARAQKLGLRLTRVIKMTTYPVVKEAVLHEVGTGIALQDSFFPSSQLVERPLLDMPETYRTCIVTPADKRELKFIRTFIEFADASVASKSGQEAPRKPAVAPASRRS